VKRKVSEMAMDQCLVELRAACRRPIDRAAIDVVAEWMRPNFEQVLDDPDGRRRWGDHGQQMRENGRHIGAIADFLGYAANVETIRLEQLKPAFQMVAAACRVGVPGSVETADADDAERFIRSMITPGR
jgi:hypothetical protein